MSPATLYREGTDLDDLLAELDQQYPGRVRVVEIARPREGGVLGFFAKQRVGVHYRLVEPSGSVAVSDIYDASAVRSAAGDVRGADSGSARGGSARGGTARGGVRAAGTSVSDAGASDAGASDAGASDARVADVGITDDDEAAPGGLQFAQVLAELAVRKAARAAVPRPRGAASIGTAPIGTALTNAASSDIIQGDTVQGGTAPVDSAPAAAAPRGTPERVTRQYVAAQARAEAAAAQIAAELEATPGSGFVPAPPPPPVAGPALTAPDPGAAELADPAAVGVRSNVATAQAGTTRRGPRAVARFQPLAAENLRAAQSSVTAGGHVRAGQLNWPLATVNNAAHSTNPADHPKVTTNPDNTAHSEVTARSHGPIGVLEAIESGAPAQDPAAGSSYLDQPGGGDTAGCAGISLTVRRQLIELGVPVDRVPGEGRHAFAAIDALVQALPPAPAPPTERGQVLVLAGRSREAAIAADALLTAAGGAFSEVWSYGCPAGIGGGRSADHVISSAPQAAALVAELRSSATGPALIVVGTDGPSWTTRPAEVVAALGPDALWAVVDATVKPIDARAALRRLGAADAIVVCGAEHSSSPATVWELDLPIALLDGRPSTPAAWAVLLMSKLTEMERTCSDVPC